MYKLIIGQLTSNVMYMIDYIKSFLRTLSSSVLICGLGICITSIGCSVLGFFCGLGMFFTFVACSFVGLFCSSNI